MEISPPILVKKNFLAAHPSKDVISENLILNIITVVFNTSSRGRRMAPGSFCVVIYVFFMCLCAWLSGGRPAFPSPGHAQCLAQCPERNCALASVDRRTLDLRTHLGAQRAFEVI